MTTLLALGTVLAVGWTVLLVALVHAVRGFLLAFQERGRVLEEIITGLEARISGLEVRVAGLPSLWEDERERVEKAAERARYAARRAEALKRERDGEPDASDDVHGFDGNGSSPQGVLPLRQSVGEPPADPLTQARRALILQSLGR